MLLHHEAPQLDLSVLHERIAVTLEEAQRCCSQLAHQGLFVGLCAGANACAAWKLAERGHFHTIVTILPDVAQPVSIRPPHRASDHAGQSRALDEAG
jgi:cysteine synthase